MGPGASKVGMLIGVGLIRAYQLVLGPFTGGACRFEPSCSEYGRQAVERHGFWKGLWLATRRVARCHPFARPGFDPVPPAGTGLESETCPRRP